VRPPPAILAAALTGLRLAELAALPWQYVDFGIERVHMRCSDCWESKWVKTPKSSKAPSVGMAPERWTVCPSEKASPLTDKDLRDLALCVLMDRRHPGAGGRTSPTCCHR
jgi:hypothetical protein